ncbi:hypothetical protein RN001_008487 [Aquatica leii]|uniref:Uncharacterized protein n=1 Tax=Aquatica leii TaxID=1421715 RepID=A0AAN7PFI1_9COLE|nr:hypothetical protein RN001_008487 [Aquatica leii]
MKKGAKWAASEPSRRQDSIISSKARENNQSAFVPSYEKDPENMNFLMTNEYLRIWLKQRTVYELDFYSKSEADGVREFKRRFVQRIMKPKPTSIRVLPIIKLKRFNKPSTKKNLKKDEELKTES